MSSSVICIATSTWHGYALGAANRKLPSPSKRPASQAISASIMSKKYHSRNGARKGDRTPVTGSTIQFPATERCEHLEDREGVEPILFCGLKVRCPTREATGPNWSTHEVPPLGNSVIGRVHRLPCSAWMVGRSRAARGPSKDKIYSLAGGSCRLSRPVNWSPVPVLIRVIAHTKGECAADARGRWRSAGVSNSIP